jgi:hypothetical protein
MQVEATASRLGGVIHQGGNAHGLGSAAGDQRLDSCGLTAGLDPVVDHQHLVGWAQRVRVQAQQQLPSPPVRRGLDLDRRAGMVAPLLADQDQPGPQLSGDQRPEYEPASGLATTVTAASENGAARAAPTTPSTSALRNTRDRSAWPSTHRKAPITSWRTAARSASFMPLSCGSYHQEWLRADLGAVCAQVLAGHRWLAATGLVGSRRTR